VNSPSQETPADYSTPKSADILPDEQLVMMARVEALLFVAPGPVEVGRLATALETTNRTIENALNNLSNHYKGRGLAIEHNRYGYQITSSPEWSEEVERFLELETTSRLTKAALEVLAVVAYQQPVTRPYIDSIRGVNSDSSLRTLMRYGLIEEVGRTDAPGRPILYATTPDFLQYFGLGDLDELPPLSTELEDQLESPAEQTASTNGRDESGDDG
jgi:segregation and condensation protein B